MAYRSILAYLDDGNDAARLELAAALARAFDAELAATYLVPGRELTPFTSALLPEAVVEHRLRDSGEAQARAEARLREAAARHSLERVSFSAPAGRPVDAGVLHARYADLCVIGQPRDDDAHVAFERELLHAVLMNAGRPALLVPYAEAPEVVGQSVLVAWKESRESARAIADALPFLERAREVTVVSISARGEDSTRETLADKDVAAWLARHGVRATVHHEVADDVDAGNLLLSRAADMGADLLVMGAYSRPRLSEVVWGGVTRLVLSAMTVPVFMSH